MDKIQEILKTCLKRTNNPLIFGRTFYNYSKSKFNVWADYHAPEKEKDPIDEFTQLMFDSGNEHEEEVCNKLYPGVKKMDFPTKTKAFEYLIEECFKGTKVFRDFPLFYLEETSMAKPDILELNKSHQSIFGDHHYIIKEIKLAKNIRKEHIMQTMFSNYLIGKIQGYTPSSFYLINKEYEEFKFDFKDYEDEFISMFNEIREIINGKPIDPVIGSVNWPWESYALKLAVKSKDLSLIIGLGYDKKMLLNEHGIKNLKDLADINLKSKIKGITPKTLKNLKISAKSLLKGKHYFLSKVKLKKHKTELFVDFESSTEMKIGDFAGNIDYLIGVLKRVNGKEEFIPFLADTLEDEEEMVHRFLDFMAEQKDFVIYHYSTYEVRRFKHLFEKYDIDKDIQDLIINNMVDILNIVRKNIAFPVYSNSLKMIAPYLGFKWRLKDIDAAQSIVLYLDYIKNNDRSNLDKILTYNEDDVKALMIVKDFIEKGK